MKRRIFIRLKSGQRIFDTWYGPGIVIAKTKRRCLIKLQSQNEAWDYDLTHIETFVRIGSLRDWRKHCKQTGMAYKLHRSSK